MLNSAEIETKRILVGSTRWQKEILDIDVMAMASIPALSMQEWTAHMHTHTHAREWATDQTNVIPNALKKHLDAMRKEMK